MKTKIYVQISDTGSKWLTQEIQDVNGQWLYRSKKLMNDTDLLTRQHIFDFKDQITDYSNIWKDARKEQLLELRKEHPCKKPKENWKAV
jgi:hypothetical protein